MEYTTLGSTGTKVSKICFGAARFGHEEGGTVRTTHDQAFELLDAAWDRGVNFLDTANVYGTPSGTSEQWIGEWLEDHDREEFVIASKVYAEVADHPNGAGLSRKHIRDQIDETLSRLGTDYLDVYYIHHWDDDTPIRETLRTLDTLVEEGKVNYLGISNAAAWKLTKALWTSDANGLERFEVAQPHYNAAHRAEIADYLDVCADQGLAVCPYSPLAGGFLTGKYRRDDDAPEDSRGELRDWKDKHTDRQWRVLDEVLAVADELDASPAQVAIRWLVDESRFTSVPIIGARSLDQLTENVGAVDLSLSDDQFRRIEEAYYEDE